MVPGKDARRGQGWTPGRLAVGLVAFVSAILTVPAVAEAREPMELVIQDDRALLHGNGVDPATGNQEAEVRDSLQKIRDLGFDRVRMTAGWSLLTRDPDSKQRPDFDAADPAAYPHSSHWGNLDRAVRLAHEYGLKVMIDVAFWAPAWATDEPAGAGRARTNVNADHFRDFAAAVAKRYSGSFTPPDSGDGGDGGGGDGGEDGDPPSSDEQFLEDVFGGVIPGSQGNQQQSQYNDAGDPGPADLIDDLFGGDDGDGGGDEGGDPAPEPQPEPEQGGQQPEQGQQPQGGPVPKVSMFTLWNEPNHPGFVEPQWRREGDRYVPHSTTVYRPMVYKAYDAIKAARPDGIVLVGATSSVGSHTGRGKGAVPPLRFIRALACVDDSLEPLSTPECKDFRKIPGDGWSHHPYSLHSEPGARNARNKPDNAPIGELGKLTTLLDQLVKRGRIASSLRDVYLTEYGYETNPPDPNEKFSTGDQAKFLPWAEFLAWRNPSVKMFPQFLLRDVPPRQNAEGSSPTRSFGDWQTGLYFENGTPKPAAETFKAGLYVERRVKRTTKDVIMVWGRVHRGSGARRVRLEVGGRGGWKVKSSSAVAKQARARSSAVAFATAADGAFTRFGTHVRGGRYRLSYLVDGKWSTSPSVSPVTIKPKPRKRSRKRRSSKRKGKRKGKGKRSRSARHRSAGNGLGS